MLTGKLLYSGETVTETIAHVITQPANLDALPPSTPASVRRILRRCLEKDPRKRFQSAGDVRIELEEALVSGLPAEAGSPNSDLVASWMDATADGSRIVILKGDDAPGAAGHRHVTLMTNFFDHVRKTVR